MGIDQDGVAAVAHGDRPLRADARRNRERVLTVAQEVFAAEGLSVPVHEIARRAGVGTGTVSRHFPTKRSLFRAILLERLHSYVRRADELCDSDDPGGTFFSYFAFLVHEGGMDRGLSESLSGPGFDKHAIVSNSDYDVTGALGRLLVRAQDAGAVRADVTADDAMALLVACLSRPAEGDDGADARRRLVDIACQGMRA
ncbi:TetR family transcriptional regulator [Nocardiopsis sp. Huas11]|uniref:TetR/AcrR family transcriptional regulator n=1 Tax=Nocardiopsis sp. Huas11 TaxID=2183912 RepID=UPI000EB5BABD|nr:TetR/AcrR family transcriptional regulator [Nocardiopsis sp. Huas11]RKS07345.1 TetR family transcriptional regulator [Nocardiopsis sp. Huas11]